MIRIQKNNSMRNQKLRQCELPLSITDTIKHISLKVTIWVQLYLKDTGLHFKYVHVQYMIWNLKLSLHTQCSILIFSWHFCFVFLFSHQRYLSIYYRFQIMYCTCTYLKCNPVSFRVPLEVDRFVAYFSLIGDVLFFIIINI
jgi:hypothetical protein